MEIIFGNEPKNNLESKFLERILAFGKLGSICHGYEINCQLCFMIQRKMWRDF